MSVIHFARSCLLKGEEQTALQTEQDSQPIAPTALRKTLRTCTCKQPMRGHSRTKCREDAEAH